MSLVMVNWLCSIMLINRKHECCFPGLAKLMRSLQDVSVSIKVFSTFHSLRRVFGPIENIFAIFPSSRLRALARHAFSFHESTLNSNRRLCGGGRAARTHQSLVAFLQPPKSECRFRSTAGPENKTEMIVSNSGPQIEVPDPFLTGYTRPPTGQFGNVRVRLSSRS